MNRLLLVGMLGIAGSGLVLTAGCDRSPAPPPAIVQAQHETASKPADPPPTTQELLSGPYRKVALPGMPLAIQAPASWKIEYTGSITFLEGPTGTDQAMIQLAQPQRDPIPADRLDSVIERLKNEQEKSGPPNTFEMRYLGRARVLERISASKPVANPKLDFRGEPIMDAAGIPVTVMTTLVHWTVTVYVPDGNSFGSYELNVIGLTTDQFVSDGELLRKILASVTLEDGQPSTMP